MATTICVLLLALTCFSPLGWADTLTLQNNAEINGRTSYKNGTFKVIARYRSGTKTLKLDRADLRSLEVNARDFNPGEPPKDISIFVDHLTSTRNASDDSTEASGRQKAAAKAADKQGKSTAVNHPVLGAESFNPSTDDVLWLRTKSKLTGRLVSIESGNLTFESGKEERRFQLDEVATILIAPN